MRHAAMVTLFAVAWPWACSRDFDVFEPREGREQGDGGSAGSGSGGSGGDAGAGQDAGLDALQDSAFDGSEDVVADVALDAAPDAVEDAPDAPTVACLEPEGQIWSDNGHCYFPLNQTRSWAQHRDACQAAGAYLVTITSQAEQTFVGAIQSNNDRWAGLRRISDAFAWTTSEPYDFTYWASGEPNNSGDCVRLRANDARWTDRACTDTFWALCERE